MDPCFLEATVTLDIIWEEFLGDKISKTSNKIYNKIDFINFYTVFCLY